jgi:CTP synthase (UTP-ammonia lyase)
METPVIALIGDYNPDVVAHDAIKKGFMLKKQIGSCAVEAQWLPTESIVPRDDRALQCFAGIWCVPNSPYKNTEGALWAIQYARTNSVPFLGTCGGYQHALLEYARNALDLKEVAHAELDPMTSFRLLDRMQCPLIEQSQRIIVTDTQFRSIYGADSGPEGFHCSFGLNPQHEDVFAGTPLAIVARSEDGQPRAFRLEGHPFFIGTQFQPERRALAGSVHALVLAFLTASVKAAS